MQIKTRFSGNNFIHEYECSESKTHAITPASSIYYLGTLLLRRREDNKQVRMVYAGGKPPSRDRDRKQEYNTKYYRNAADAARSQTELNRNALGASLQTDPESQRV